MQEQYIAYAEIAQRVEAVKKVFASRALCVDPGSALGQLLRQASALDAAWRAGTIPDIRVLVDTAHANRLAEAVLMLRDEQAIDEALRRIARNDMQPSGRAPSQGKDALWELVLLAFLKGQGAVARMQDPPDIVADFGFGDYPIACKKIYSEGSVESRLRKGASQLRPFRNGGLIALNLDDLVPSGVLLHGSDKRAAGAFLDRFNLDFIDRHRDVMQRYVRDGKCDGFWISSSTVTDLVQERTAFNLFTQTSLWHLNEASEASRARMHRAAAIVGAAT